MLVWISALREIYTIGWLDEIAWIPTESMICDAQTKRKDGLDMVWMIFYRTGVRAPLHMPG